MPKVSKLIPCQKCNTFPENKWVRKGIWSALVTYEWLECPKCGRRPEYARLCLETALDDWHELNKQEVSKCE